MIKINVTSKNPYWLEAANQWVIFKYGQVVELGTSRTKDNSYQRLGWGLELAGASWFTEVRYSNHLAILPLYILVLYCSIVLKQQSLD